jgi:hypothetical protein
MAVDYTTFVYNHIPSPAVGISQVELLSRSSFAHQQLHNLHVWRSPTYMLNPTLQDGRKIPHWRPRSKREIFVRLSPVHANSVPLVLSCATLTISPQFHVVFDDKFTTTISQSEDDEEPDWWDQLIDTDRA